MTRGEAYRARLGTGADEIAPVRDAVGAIASAHGFADRVDDVTLALVEIVANAQRHGRPPIEVTAWADGRLVVEVLDHGPGFDHEAAWRAHPPPTFAPSGRGLWIARQVSDLVSVERRGGLTTVRLELAADPPGGA